MFSSSRFTSFINYYRSLPVSAAGVPRRLDFKPGDITAMLPWVFILHRTVPRAFTIGLVGSSIEHIFRPGMTGRSVYDFYPLSERASQTAFMETMVQNPCGGLVQRDLVLEHRSLRPMHALMLPLADRDGCSIDRLIGVAALGVAEERDHQRGEIKARHATIARSRFIDFVDIGAGVPPEAAPNLSVLAA